MTIIKWYLEKEIPSKPIEMLHLDLNLERARVNNLGFGDSELEVRF